MDVCKPLLGGIGDEIFRQFNRDKHAGEMPECFGFTLSNERIAAYDAEHPAPGPFNSPMPVNVLYDILLFFVDRVYEAGADG